MKSITIKLAMVLFVITLASCKKERTCTCTNTYKSSASVVSSSSTSTSTYKKVSNNVAKGACASYETTYQEGNETITETSDCTLK